MTRINPRWLLIIGLGLALPPTIGASMAMGGWQAVMAGAYVGVEALGIAVAFFSMIDRPGAASFLRPGPSKRERELEVEVEGLRTALLADSPTRVLLPCATEATVKELQGADSLHTSPRVTLYFKGGYACIPVDSLDNWKVGQKATIAVRQ